MASKVSADLMDCVIVGGGAAGLTAATYLARFRRSFIVMDGGASRLRRIPRTHNTPGFPDGIVGLDLYRRLREQAEINGATLQSGVASALTPCRDGFRLETTLGVVAARTVLLATGTTLCEPRIDHLDVGLADGRIRYCPICDGFEAQGQKIGVLAGARSALSEAKFLRAYSERVFYVPASVSAELGEQEVAAAERHGIAVLAAALDVRLVEGGVEIVSHDRPPLLLDTIYPCLGRSPQTALGAALGAAVSDEGGLMVDAHQRTNVAGLYGAGDVLQGLDQIASAFGQAAIAATTIHNSLAGQA
ncbi:MAG: NAD(P)/FAD-dependent oxidoreductase [Vitreimonas sp.]